MIVITWYIPNDTNGKKTVSPHSVLQRLLAAIGGATIYPGQGYWEGIVEPITIIEHWSDKNEQQAVRYAKRVAIWIGASLAQQAVSYKINGKPYIVEL